MLRFLLIFMLSGVAFADHSKTTCKYDVLVSAEKEFSSQRKAEKACDDWGSEFCEVYSSEDYYIAYFELKKTFKAESSERSKAIKKVFSLIGAFVVKKDLDKQVFDLNAGFDGCKKQKIDHGGGY